MDELEAKKLKVQLRKTEAAIEELELKAYMRKLEIEQIEDHIQKQHELKARLEEQLGEK